MRQFIDLPRAHRSVGCQNNAQAVDGIIKVIAQIQVFPESIQEASLLTVTQILVTGFVRRGGDFIRLEEPAVTASVCTAQTPAVRAGM